jgi:hypothetical protein
MRRDMIGFFDGFFDEYFGERVHLTLFLEDFNAWSRVTGTGL